MQLRAHMKYMCLLMVRIGAYVDREPVSSTVVYNAVQTNFARNALSCCYCHIAVHDFSSTKFALDPLFVTNLTRGLCLNGGLTTAR